MNSTGKYLVMYDHAARPPQKFYDLLTVLVNAGGLQYVQKSIYIAKGPDDAADLVALLEWYRAASIKAVPISEGTLDQAADRKAAKERIAAMHVPKKRGRKPTLKGKRK